MVSACAAGPVALSLRKCAHPFAFIGEDVDCKGDSGMLPNKRLLSVLLGEWPAVAVEC